MRIEETSNGDNCASDDARGTLFLMSGVALMVFGAGLILSNPLVRRYLGQASVSGLLSAAIPDVERYIKLRAM